MEKGISHFKKLLRLRLEPETYEGRRKFRGKKKFKLNKLIIYIYSNPLIIYVFYFFSPTGAYKGNNKMY